MLLSEVYRNKSIDIKFPSFKDEIRAKIYEKYGRIPKVDTDALVGIEVEIENCKAIYDAEMDDLNLKIFRLLWDITEDGSLRNTGLEFVSKPLKGFNVGLALSILGGYIDHYYPKASPSSRTGIHVHLNAQGLTIPQIFAWIITYTVFEKLTYHVSGKRDKNLFCLPTWAWRGNLDVAIDYLARGNESGAISRGLVEQGLKYAGINFLPLRDKGTIEFRQMKTTKNLKQVSEWVRLLCSIRDYSIEQVKTVEDLEAYMKKISTFNTTSTYDYFMSDVFKSNEFKYDGFEKDMAFGVTQVKELEAEYYRAQNEQKKIQREYDEARLKQPVAGAVNKEDRAVAARELLDLLDQWRI